MTLETSGGLKRVAQEGRRNQAQIRTQTDDRGQYGQRDQTSMAGVDALPMVWSPVSVRAHRASRTPSTPLDPLRPVGGEPRGAGSAVPVLVPAAAHRGSPDESSGRAALRPSALEPYSNGRRKPSPGVGSGSAPQ